MKRFSIDEKIIALLRHYGLSQADLSRMLGIKRSSINTWIKGKHVPSSRNIDKLSRIFSIKISWFRDEQAPFPPVEIHMLENGERAIKPELEGIDSTFKKTPPGQHQAKQNIKKINDALFLVINSDLQSIFSDIQASMYDKSNHEISNICGKLKKYINKITVENKIKVKNLGGEKEEIQ